MFTPVVRFFARIWSHLSRSTARWAYLVAILCIVIYATIPNVWTFSDPVRQVMLILTSVAIGAALLPELPTNLWSIDATRVRALVPERQRAHLAQALIEAESDDTRWNELIWNHAMQPLLSASARPWQYLWDMDYDVSVHLSQSIEIAGIDRTLDAVSVQQKSIRTLARPGVDRLWISLARTPAALRDEFSAPGCLGRELVDIGDDLSGEAWQSAVKQHCSVSMTINGETIALEPQAESESPALLRWMTPPGYRIPAGQVRVRLAYDFYSDPEIREFGVFFSSYYVGGATDITLRLHDSEDRSEVSAEHFAAHALGDSTRPTATYSATPVVQQVAYSTGRDSLLWPGSGVIFRWRPRT